MTQHHRPMKPLLLGLDIGGTKCAAIVGNSAGQIQERIEWPSRADRGPAAMLREIASQARKLCRTNPDIGAVGVAIGGPLDAAQGIILAPPNLPGWTGIPLKAKLEQTLGLPVQVEHDAAACALAEYHWGAGRGAEIVAYLTCGTGFGLGLVVRGQVYRGARGRNCEIGHVRYQATGPVAFGKAGSLEAFCSGTGVRHLAAWLFPQRWSNSAPRPSELARLATRGNRAARAVIALNARAVGDACAGLADTLGPDVIVLGSLAQHLGAGWVRQVRAQFGREVLPATRRICRIQPAQLGKRLQDCSALVVAVTP